MIKRSLSLLLITAIMLAFCGCSRKKQGYVYYLNFPMLLPVTISVGILEFMWIWNDYLLPYLVLDMTRRGSQRIKPFQSSF